MKPLFITVDTEGDALWDNPTDIRTENVLWIPRFQELCEKYNFIPIWLTDYEVVQDDRYIEYIKAKNDAGLCEVGIHIHARNNPPLYKLEGEKERGAAYLIEYPHNIMRDKIAFLKDRLESRLKHQVITHRAGRWAINDAYIRMLCEIGIKYDCSVTPGINWSSHEGITPGSQGTDYSNSKNGSYILYDDGNNKVVEYPMTIVDCHKFIMPARLTFKNFIKSGYQFVKQTKIWVRPNLGNLNQIKYALKVADQNDEEYVEFMIHSSELMPGGGPNHDSENEIEILFENIEKFFEYAKGMGYTGYTFETWENRDRKK